MSGRSLSPARARTERCFTHFARPCSGRLAIPAGGSTPSCQGASVSLNLSHAVAKPTVPHCAGHTRQRTSFIPSSESTYTRGTSWRLRHAVAYSCAHAKRCNLPAKATRWSPPQSSSDGAPSALHTLTLHSVMYGRGQCLSILATCEGGSRAHFARPSSGQRAILA